MTDYTVFDGHNDFLFRYARAPKAQRAAMWIEGEGRITLTSLGCKLRDSLVVFSRFGFRRLMMQVVSISKR